MSNLKAYQQDFIKFCIQSNILRFGEFTLKSGRVSPYFFNAGLFNTGVSLSKLGTCYVACLQESGLAFDMLFGPAYKGIPLVSACALSFASLSHCNLPFAFNRKEVKAHGEGGHLVGANLAGRRVCIVDDVITAGTAIRHSIKLIEEAGAVVAGVVVLLDRQERGQGALSANAEIEQEYNIPVQSVIRLDDIVEFVQHTPSYRKSLAGIQAYRKAYGTKS